MAKKNVGIWVGAQKGAVREARKGILKIINSKCDETTKVAALNAITSAASVNYSTITGCNIEMPKK